MSPRLLSSNEKSVKLSPTEQRVYFQLYGLEVFRTRDVYTVIENKKTAWNIVSRLKNKGYIREIKRGLYGIVPAQMIGEDFTVDRILVASRLVEPYFLSHHTALEVHGVAHSFFNTVYITSGSPLRPFEYQGITYKVVATKHLFGYAEVGRGRQAINVSDRERSVLDCIRNMGYAGGIEELLRSITRFPSLDFKRLLDYLEKFGETSLYHRTGYLLDLLREDLRAPEWFFEKIMGRLGSRAYYLTGKKGTYVRKWNVIAPGNIKELVKVA
ncbi:MAG: hypothetical protein V3R93_04835 [Candidatus Hydrothermarchaeaceae archaeon]